MEASELGEMLREHLEIRLMIEQDSFGNVLIAEVTFAGEIVDSGTIHISELND